MLRKIIKITDKGNLYIGKNQSLTSNPDWAVQLTQHDAEEFVQALKKKNGGQYKIV